MGNDLLTGFLAGQSESNNSGNNGGGNNGSNGGGFFGNEGLWAVIILAIIFGWGNNGFGGRNNGSGNGGENVTVVPYPAGGSFGGALTQADLCSEFNFNNLTRAVTGIQQGVCDSTYALNNAITNGTNTLQIAVMQGFNGVDRAMCNQGYQTQAGFNALGNQIANCCCETKSAIGDVKYQMATDTCAVQNSIQGAARDIIDNQNANYRGLMDFMVQSKIDALQAENQSLKLSASQDRQNALLTTAMSAQTNQIIDALQPQTPVPSYQVPAPYPYCVPQNGGGCGSCC